MSAAAIERRHAGRVPATVLLGVGLAAVILFGCGASARKAQPADFRALYPPSLESGARAASGSIKGDFDQCSGSSELVDAIGCWESFLRAWDCVDCEYEDGFHVLHVQVAQLELARAYYLAGRAADGDEVLKKLDPFGLEE